MTCGCQPRHQLGRLYAGYAGYEHGANRVRHPNAFAELGRCQPALVFFAKAQTVEDGEYLLGPRDLHVVLGRGHDAGAMMQIAVDALFDEDLAGARHQLRQLLPRVSRQGPTVISKSIAALQRPHQPGAIATGGTVPDVRDLDGHYVEVSLNLLRKIRDPDYGTTPAHDRNVGGGVCLKWGLRGVTLEAIPLQGRAGRLWASG